MALVAGPQIVAFAAEQLVIGGWGGDWDKMAQKYVYVPFKQQFKTDVVLSYGNSADIFARARAQRADPQMDLVTLTELMTINGVDQGLLAPLRPDNVPNLADVWSKAQMPPFGPAILLAEVGIAYRTDKVRTPPVSWRDLWKPEYKGRVAIPSYGQASALSFIVISAMLEGGNERTIDPAFRLLRQIEPNIIATYASDSDVYALLERGEAWLAVWYNGPAFAMKGKGLPIEFVRPKEGVPGIRSFINVVKGAKHRDLAEKLVNIHIGPDAQKGMAEMIFYGPVNRKVTLPKDLIEKMPYGEEAMRKFLVFDWRYIVYQLPNWQEDWMKIFAR
jgi:putative spermidine/putrescine transport system substrate-binding protein